MDLKTYAIETFEIAEWNVLKAIFRLSPTNFEKQITEKLNPIRWVIGHLTIQMDTIFNGFCYGKELLDKEFREYFEMGLEQRKGREFPVSYTELINRFLEFSQSSRDYLDCLPVEKFFKLPEKNAKKNKETIAELVQRVSLHFLGHTGQIYQIKRELGKGGTFIMGVKKKNRVESRKKWLKWWNGNKNKYE
jgi:uncharacterized damage-inducible protein DinB